NPPWLVRVTELVVYDTRGDVGMYPDLSVAMWGGDSPPTRLVAGFGGQDVDHCPTRPVGAVGQERMHFAGGPVDRDGLGHRPGRGWQLRHTPTPFGREERSRYLTMPRPESHRAQPVDRAMGADAHRSSAARQPQADQSPAPASAARRSRAASSDACAVLGGIERVRAYPAAIRRALTNRSERPG